MNKAKRVKIAGEVWKWFLDTEAPCCGLEYGCTLTKFLLYPPKKYFGGRTETVDATDVLRSVLEDEYGDLVRRVGPNRIVRIPDCIPPRLAKKVIRLVRVSWGAEPD